MSNLKQKGLGYEENGLNLREIDLIPGKNSWKIKGSKKRISRINPIGTVFFLAFNHSLINLFQNPSAPMIPHFKAEFLILTFRGNNYIIIT